MQLQHMELLRIKSRLDAVLADGSPEMRSFVAEVRLSAHSTANSLSLLPFTYTLHHPPLQPPRWS